MIERIHPRHPHPDPGHVMRTYRGHMVAQKRKPGGTRAIILRRDYIETYLWAKREWLQDNEMGR